jgi:HK97 family phage major capsid protein
MDSLRCVYPSIDDQSHAGTSGVYGGVQATWTEEGAAITSSAPSFARVVLTARKLAAYFDIPNELIQDASPLLEQWIRDQLPAAIAWFEDTAFIGGATTGTGVGMPEGLLNSPAAIRVPVGTTNTIALSDVIAAYTRMLPMALPGAIWLAAPDTVGQLLKMGPMDSGTAIAPPAWLTGMQAIEGPTLRLFGHDVIVSERMPSSASSNTTTPGALTFFAPDYYLIGDRMALQVAVSEQYKFDRDLTSCRVLERLDARSWMRSPLSPFNGGVSLSSIVKVDTTATS